jgi:hypothetical protein
VTAVLVPLLVDAADPPAVAEFWAAVLTPLIAISQVNCSRSQSSVGRNTARTVRMRILTSSSRDQFSM